jgi:hypothetical protein
MWKIINTIGLMIALAVVVLVLKIDIRADCIDTAIRSAATADSIRHAHIDSLLAGVLMDAAVWHSDKKGTEQARALLKKENGD